MLRYAMLQSIAAVALSLATTGAHAVLCKYIDANGNVTYSDSPVKGATKSACFEAPTLRSDQSGACDSCAGQQSTAQNERRSDAPPHRHEALCLPTRGAVLARLMPSPV